MIQLTRYMHISGKLLEFQNYSYAKYRKYMVLSIQFCCVKQDSTRKSSINATFNSWNLEYSERLVTNVRDYESFTKFLPVRPYHRAVQCDQFWPKIGVILIFHEK